MRDSALWAPLSAMPVCLYVCLSILKYVIQMEWNKIGSNTPYLATDPVYMVYVCHLMVRDGANPVQPCKLYIPLGQPTINVSATQHCKANSSICLLLT